ncbi:MAG TPA: hypothetical protein VN823_28000 [Stellaceae bacterium]|nr:hypothetical protein [Stellaceae bacterium]
MRRVALLGAALSLAAMAANAAAKGDCFSNADLEAEQAVRFQAQLMVLSDICRDTTYGLFTQRNRDAIMAYQRQMIDHFKRAGERRADITFENYMTRLANQESIASGQRTSAEICQPNNTLIVTANSIGTSKEFRAYAASQAAANRATYLACK